jgi:hypothetical protein
MRKLIALILVAGLSAFPAMAQISGATGLGVNAGFISATVVGTGDAPDGSFFNADAQTQMAAHKARWARIEARKLKKSETKLQ